MKLSTPSGVAVKVGVGVRDGVYVRVGVRVMAGVRLGPDVAVPGQDNFVGDAHTVGVGEPAGGVAVPAASGAATSDSGASGPRAQAHSSAKATARGLRDVTGEVPRSIRLTGWLASMEHLLPWTLNRTR
jgi:type IV secretory pathway TrbL component